MNTLSPSLLSAELYRIASKIDSSRSPSRELVLKDLNRIVMAMDVEAGDYEAGAGLKALGAGVLAFWLAGVVNTIKKSDGTIHGPEIVEQLAEWVNQKAGPEVIKAAEVVSEKTTKDEGSDIIQKAMKGEEKTIKTPSGKIIKVLCEENQCTIIK